MTPQQDSDLLDFRTLVRDFAKREVIPHLPRWESEHRMDRELFLRAGSAGLLGVCVPATLGGGGMTSYRYNAVIAEELGRAGASSVSMAICGFNDLVAPYLLLLGTLSQQQQWLPDLCSGVSISALAITEPAAGSDMRALATKAVRDGSGPDADYLVSGSKTFISNGLNADWLLTAVRTGEGKQPLSLFMIDAHAPGVSRTSAGEKTGLHAQDTATIYFDSVRVPADARLGEEGGGLTALSMNLRQERLCAAIMATASQRRMVDLAREHVKDRSAFGGRLADLQSVRFTLADMATRAEVTAAFVETCIAEFLDGTLTADKAAMAKWWATHTQQKIAYDAVQLHGGMGFFMETPVAREAADARATTLYAGTTEVMKDIIGRSLTR